MKKRFKNILIRNRKKNGILILICAVVSSVALGMLSGCSVTKQNTEKENTEKENIENGDAANEDMENVSQQSGTEADQTVSKPADNSAADNHPLENTMTLTFSKEGEQEQKQATLAVGNGYSFYLPDDEKWHLSAHDLWLTDINEQVALWVTHFEGESEAFVKQKLQEDGYTEEDSGKWRKQEGDFLYHAEQKVYENDVWAIFYSYPADFEEGWGRELPVIVNTFALSKEADQGTINPVAGTGENPGAEDYQKISTAAETFAQAYFNKDAADVLKCLADTYEGEADIYESTGTISDLTVKGLSDIDEEEMENGTCNVSIEFRDSNYEDMFLYLTCNLVKEQGEWKVQSYGIEG